MNNRTLLLLFFILCNLPLQCTEKILMVIAHNGFQPLEYSAPKQLLQKAGYTVETASDKSGTARAAYTNLTTHVDVTLENVQPEEYKAILFVGGPGCLGHLDNSLSYAIIKKAYEKNILIGAICLAPRILAASGILSGKKATGWDGDNNLAKIFASHDVHYIRNKKVVVDNNIITATDPTAAAAFGKAIIQALKKGK